MSRIILLGPQRLEPSLAAALVDLEVQGPVALITAGWRDAEGEDGSISEQAGVETVNLELYQRADRVFDADPELQQALRHRQRRLKQLQRLYRRRLDCALAGYRELLSVEAGDAQDQELVDGERRAALDVVRALDQHQLEAVQEIWAATDREWRPSEREAVVEQRQQIENLLESCSALVIAGGHVASLLNRMRLFDVPATLGERPIVAWSAGAMALAERIVLFHDSPPWGAGNAEVLDYGLGLCRGLLPLPHPYRRLRIDDEQRVALLVGRFAPLRCVGLDRGSILRGRGAIWAGEPVWSAERVALDLELDSAQDDLESTMATAEPGESTAAAEPTPGVQEPLAIAAATSAGSSPPALAAVADPPESILALLDVKAQPTEEEVDQLLETVSFPFVDGTSATFVYRGKADRVSLRHWIYGLPSSIPFERAGTSDLWFLRLEIPEHSRVEYKIDVVVGRRHRWVRDPLNAERAHDPFGANSVLHGAGYQTPDWVLPHPETRSGSWSKIEIESKALDEQRTIRVYQPAGRRRYRRHPLLIVHDGDDYLRFASLETVLDNVIERLEVEPLVVAFTSSPRRLVDYAADRRHSDFLVEELIPRLEAELPIRTDPRSRGLMGASFGAVATLAAAWHHPGVFGRLLLQSGSFAFSDLGGQHQRGPAFDPVVRFMKDFRENPGRPAGRLFVSCGVYESLIYENRSLLPLLQSTGAEVRYVEARDGHNWENWRDRLREGLSWSFPGPLWMVYE